MARVILIGYKGSQKQEGLTALLVSTRQNDILPFAFSSADAVLASENTLI